MNMKITINTNGTNGIIPNELNEMSQEVHFLSLASLLSSQLLIEHANCS